jgi:excisionase family DNA binding protein
MKPELLTTTEAAQLIGVGTTSVKRWADGGLLPFVKTAGGHRRFARAEVERFRRDLPGTAAPGDDLSAWMTRLLHGPAYEVDAALLSARGRLGAWHQVADALGPVIVEIGRRWADGEISVLEEHLCAERLSRALGRVGEALPARPGAPGCLLACAEGDEHTLGLSLAELCLREAGWTPLWSGRLTPIAEVVGFVEAGRARLVALSASSFSRDAGALGRQAGLVAAACLAAGARLVLGGQGAWPEAPAHAVRLHDFGPFHRLAVEELEHHEGRGG